MNLATLAPPIVAATVLNIFVFALASRRHHVDQGQGETPWLLSLGAIVYGLSSLAFLYHARTRPLTHGLDVFGVALAAEAMGGVIAYVLVQGFVASPNQSWRQRAPLLGLGLLLLFAMVQAMFSH